MRPDRYTRAQRILQACPSSRDGLSATIAQTIVRLTNFTAAGELALSNCGRVRYA